MKKIIFLITISFVSLLAAQQDTKEAHEISTQINNSEILLQQKINKEVNLLNKDILKNTKRTITNENKIEHLFITKLGVQAILLTLVLTFLSIFSINQIIKNRVDKSERELKKKFKDSIENVKEAEIRTVEHIKNSEKDNKELRGQSQILLVNEVSTPVNKDLQRIFIAGSSKVQFNCTQIDIKELTYKKIKNELVNQKAPHPTDFELIIFDNSSADGRKWDKDCLNNDMIPLVKEFLSIGIAVLYYSNDQFFPSYLLEYKNIPNKHLLTYANAVPNLYNNAMTVLKLQNLYKD
ncbi:conserved hypothetical protein [Tenacibaculum maritimum]|uniref:hypothetical protein n=1 Tax=Tenacibaculum maritimum TaxID=107401 RepID=UPI0012E638A9|nr:hypothetical protein [Tenacibaculum maritimum]CAA0159774.1 conserved hypothetical protein [Tenacibaculum maritimum]CAA0217125.1 conserved hypothetical protein [Tenacibaculum maritimum]